MAAGDLIPLGSYIALNAAVYMPIVTIFATWLTLSSLLTRRHGRSGGQRQDRCGPDGDGRTHVALGIDQDSGRSAASAKCSPNTEALVQHHR
jgi:hypothetical protein